MTYNIWNYRQPWPERRALIARLIREYEPQVVCLQETRHDWRFYRGAGQADQLAELCGYHVTSAVGQVYVPMLRVDEGLAVLTREPPLRVMETGLTVHPRERNDENQRIVLGVAIRSNSTDVHIYDAHFSLSASARITNAAETVRFIRRTSHSVPTILMGDLNAVPSAAPIRLLVGDEEAMGERGDFVDCWTVARPYDPGYTDPAWKPIERIDYVMTRNVDEERILRAVIIGTEPTDGVYPSDHTGIVVDLDI